MAPRRKTTVFRRAPRVPQEQYEHSNTTKALQAGDVKLCYASYTLAGSDGSGDKENQDCLSVEVLRHERHRDAEPVVFFGVFDGHGEQGGIVAALAAEQLPQFIGELHPQAGDPEDALQSGFASTQQFLLQQPGLDCSLSGCTAVVALLVNDSLVVANAGDSRCLAGRFEGNHEVVAYELTNDHTPALLHEANRVLASGGRIATLLFGGSSVGPPRVWERNTNTPGLCITRSLGDTGAKRLGVTHVPELLTFKLTKGDRYLALVSDGITEFMSSTEIIDKIHIWASEGTMPHEVARRLVREARSRWRDLGNEGIVDDCTAVVAYLVCDEGEGGEEEDDDESRKEKKGKKKKSKGTRITRSVAVTRALGLFGVGGRDGGRGGHGGSGDSRNSGGGAAKQEQPLQPSKSQPRQTSGRRPGRSVLPAFWSAIKGALPLPLWEGQEGAEKKQKKKQEEIV